MLSRFFKKESKTTGQRPGRDEVHPATAAFVVPDENTPQLNWLPGEVVNGRYRVDRIFGGAMGKVYIAEHLGWKIWMAIKAPRPEVWADREGLQRILREANGWIRLGLHPNIASCYYVQAISNIPHIFIEYVAGGTLEEWINRGRCKDMRTVLSLSIQFCNGMEFTHAKGFIHRDIKPQNILISKDGLVKITDFGILRSIQEKDTENEGPLDSQDSDATVGFRGTPNYASPEQLRNTHRVDRRTDIFSFGLCLWMMLCGKRPYKHNAQGECPDPVAATPGIFLPQSLKDILVKCVAYHKEERFNNFSELRSALNDVYIELFKVSCPYAIMEKIDMRAENLNNRAVSLAELGKYKQAAIYLSRTLEINDSLPEALLNSHMLKWRRTNEDAGRLLRRVEAGKKRFPKLSIFDSLQKEIAEFVETETDERRKKRKKNPELQLCFPKPPMEIFRESQLRRSVHHNIITLLQNRRLTECFDTLQVSWANDSYRKDKFYYKIYEQLLPEGIKRAISAVQRMVTHPGEGGPVFYLGSIPDRKLVLSASSGKSILVRSVGLRKNGVTLARTDHAIASLAAHDSGGLFAAGLGNGSVYFQSFTGAVKSTVSCGESAVKSLVFIDDGRFLLAGLECGKVVVVETKTGKTRKIDVSTSGGINCLVSLGGMQFAAGSDNGSILLYDGQTGECLREVEAHGLPVATLAVSPDRKLIASGSADRQARVWESSTLRCLQTLDRHEEAVTSVLLLADGQTLISGCDDDIIKVWKWQEAQCRHALDARGDGVCSLAHGPKPHTFLAGHQDGTVVLWTIIYELEFDDGRPSALRSS